MYTVELATFAILTCTLIMTCSTSCRTTTCFLLQSKTWHAN